MFDVKVVLKDCTDDSTHTYYFASYKEYKEWCSKVHLNFEAPTKKWSFLSVEGVL